MPRAYDIQLIDSLQKLPMERNPLRRINYQTPQTAASTTTVDLWTPFVNETLIPLLMQLFDFSWIAQLLNPLLGLEENPNLLTAGAFEDAVSLSGGQGWSWDGTDGRTANGCAVATATGVPMGLRSNLFAVAAGQILDLSVWVKWAGVSASGDAIRLEVITFSGDDQGEIFTVEKVANPAANQATWMELENTWTVPVTTLVGVTPKPVTGCKVRLAVYNTTAGTVKFDDASAVKTTLAEKTTQDVMDAIVNGFLGLFGITGSDPQQVAQAVNAQSNTTVGTTTQMMQILAALGTGHPDADDFERWDISGLGPNWSTYQTGLGGLATFNGHDAEWSAFGDAEFVTFKNDVLAASAYQIGTLVLGSAPEQGWLFDSADVGSNDIWLRCPTFASWGAREGLRLRFRSDRKTLLHWVEGGVETLIWESTEDQAEGETPLNKNLGVVPGVGAVLDFYSGVEGVSDPYRLVGKLNGVPVVDVLDEDQVSAAGVADTHRRRGFGGKVETGLFSNARPGRVKQWTAQG